MTVARSCAVYELECIEDRITSSQQHDDDDGDNGNSLEVGKRTERQIFGSELRRTALKLFSFEESEIAPLFVYFSAHYFGYPEIAKGQELDAAYMYWIRRNSYDQVWKEVIPSGWRPKAARLYEQGCEI